MPSVSKAIILARGLGTRMRQDDGGVGLSEGQARAAAAGLKAMIPIGRPFLDFVLSALADAGVGHVCLVIGPEHDALRDYYAREVRLSRVRVEFALQKEATGTADAVLAARDFVGQGHFLVLNSDNYYPVATFRTLAELNAPALPGFEREALVRLGNIDQARILRFALIRTDGDGFLDDIVEKPDDRMFTSFAEHALVSMNLWSFSPAIFEACQKIEPSSRGELELPQAVRYAVKTLGVRFRVLPFALGVLDLSYRSDIAAVANRLRDIEVRL